MDNQTYQLELKQIVEFPRCRIYRDFIRSLITNKSIRTNGGSFLLVLVNKWVDKTKRVALEHRF